MQNTSCVFSTSFKTADLFIYFIVHSQAGYLLIYVCLVLRIS